MRHGAADRIARFLQASVRHDKHPGMLPGTFPGTLPGTLPGALPGAVALVAHREHVEVVSAGHQDMASAVPMRRDSLFRIASMTKPVLAAAALSVVEEARIALDDRVDPWLPELADRRVLRGLDARLEDTVPASRPVNLRDLLTLRFGLGVVMAPPGTTPIQSAMAELGLAPGPRPLPFGPDEFMARIGSLPLIHQPGDRWMYHTGIDVLGVLIARVAGKPLGEVLVERLFSPLRMTDTGFHVPAARIDRLATAYACSADGLSVWDTGPAGSYTAPPAFPNALVSTADDYLAFCRMLLAGGAGPQGRILSRASVAVMMTDQITPEQKAASPFFPGFWDRTGWGFGGAVTTRRDDVFANPGSYGWSGGFGTHFIVDPAEELVAILLTQRLMRGPDDSAPARKLFTLAYAAIDD